MHNVTLQEVYKNFYCFQVSHNSSIKDNTDIIWNELFQTVTEICLICVHTMEIEI